MSDATTIDASFASAVNEAETSARAYLVVRQEAGTQVIDIDEGADVLMGRSSEATVRIDDAKASREHARFVRKGGALRVVDLESRNGTKLNDELVRGESRNLRSGDLICIGAAEILVAETAGIATQPSDSRAPAEPPRSIDVGIGVVVGDPAMVRVFDLVRRVAAAPTTVLILGETGVGKEVIAEQIHRQSPRAKGPFVRLNCGSLPETLLESELFGHERGAFTGAERRKIGYIEAAHGGTLFLDEVGELALGMQTRLLRFLEDKKFMRVGSREELASDVRIVAATNRNLEAEAQAGRFREDLYFRLAAFIVRVPPLRERPVEIELLAELFARQFAKRMHASAPTIAPAAMQLLRRYDWPGNVRELRNAMEHAVVLAERNVVDVEQLPDSLRHAGAGQTAAPLGSMRDQLAEIERRAMQEALDAEHGNQTRAAKRLGISRRALLYKIEKYGLKG